VANHRTGDHRTQSRLARGVRQLLGRPGSFAGIVYDTTSIASLHNLEAHELTVPDVNTKDSTGQAHLTPMSIDVSEQPHSSIGKTAITLGLGQDALRKISVNG
jgi:aromatic-L-amino-acid decarboxylase